jgi:hypothetical protein
MDERKKHGWPFWFAAAMVVAAPLLYVASVGPAYWISSRLGGDSIQVICFVYRPLFIVSNRLLGDGDEPLYRYAEVGLPKPMALARPVNRDGLPTEFQTFDPPAAR